MRGALRALLPGASVLLAAVLFLTFATDALVGEVASTYALVVGGAGLALSWVFHRSRAFIALIVLGFVDIAVMDSPDGTVALMALGTVALALLAVLGLLRDRGVGSRVGFAQLLVIGGIAGVASLFLADDERVAGFSEGVATLPLGDIVWPGYPRVTIVVALLAVMSVVYGLHRYRGAVERSLVWAVILFLVAIHPGIGSAGSALFIMASGLTITLGIVETSYAMAYRDDLTGLPGRRALMQYLDGINGTYAVAMVDIDRFKRFNDRHGHDVGDQVLQMVAKVLAGTTGGGKAYRYGGEEFTVIFPGRRSEDARPHVEELRRAVEESKFAVRSWTRPREKPEARVRAPKVAKRKVLSVTVSAGLADSEDGGSDPEVVLKKADEALYRAKEGGRNRVES